MDQRKESGVSGLLEPSLPPGIECFTSEGFNFFLSRELEEALRYAHFSAFGLFRVSGLGEAEGFEKFAKCLSRNIRGTDYLGRLSADTVGIILQHANVENAEHVIERLRHELANSFSNGEAHSILGSVAVFPTEANTLENLTSLAWNRLESTAEISTQQS